MRIYIEREGRQREISFKGTVRELLHNLNINPETVLVASGNNLLTADTNISGKEEIKVLSVISGG